MLLGWYIPDYQLFQSYGEVVNVIQESKSRAVVLGQGAAGLTAALTIARQGLKVTSISKVRPGGATCTIYAGGGFTLGIEGMTPEDHKTMTLETGRHLNRPDLLEVFAQEAPSIVKLLEDIGVSFRKRRGGLSIVKDPSFPLLGGKPLIDSLYRACLDAGVEFRQNLIASKILVGNRGVSGIECVDYQTATVETLQAEAVVLATGGGGSLYERTDNPQRITGDGYRLAFLAGCFLSDMEFVQFYPIGIDIPGGAHWFMDLSIIDRARVTNSRGEEFLKDMLLREGIKTGREANLLARDKCSVAIALENRKGTVLLHLEDVGQKEFEEDPYLSTIARMFPRSSPPWGGPVEVRPIQHYFPGGVIIGTSGETNLPGLFAAGEVTGGVDGANRVGGNALTNCLVFGSRAGMGAASYLSDSSTGQSAWKEPLVLCDIQVSRGGVRDDGAPPLGKKSCGISSRVPGGSEQNYVSIDLPCESGAKKWLTTWRDGTVRPESLREELRRLASRHLLPVRDEEGLSVCIQALDHLRESLAKQSVKDSRDILLAFENLGLWYTAAFVSLGAYIRRESRGAHFRIDYPEEREEWKRHIVIGRMGEKMVAQVS